MLPHSHNHWHLCEHEQNEDHQHSDYDHCEHFSLFSARQVASAVDIDFGDFTDNFEYDTTDRIDPVILFFNSIYPNTDPPERIIYSDISTSDRLRAPPVS
jgi:hypothetical protein